MNKKKLEIDRKHLLAFQESTRRGQIAEFKSRLELYKVKVKNSSELLVKSLDGNSFDEDREFSKHLSTLNYYAAMFLNVKGKYDRLRWAMDTLPITKEEAVKE